MTEPTDDHWKEAQELLLRVGEAAMRVPVGSPDVARFLAEALAAAEARGVALATASMNTMADRLADLAAAIRARASAPPPSGGQRAPEMETPCAQCGHDYNAHTCHTGGGPHCVAYGCICIRFVKPLGETKAEEGAGR